MKRKLIITLALVALLALVCCGVATAERSGTCGNDLTWVLSDAGRLTISGTGEMYSYNGTSTLPPWYDYRANITSVVIESGVTDIGSYDFYRCVALDSVTIPDSVERIHNNAFNSCSTLAGVTFPDSLTTIYNRAFLDCTALTDVIIPYSVTEIGYKAFYGCTALADVKIMNPNTDIGFGEASHEVFHSCSPSLVLHGLAASTAKTYATAAGITFEAMSVTGSCGTGVGYNFNPETRKLAISGSGAMTDYAYVHDVPWYSYRTAIASAEIGSGVTSVGKYAFNDCAGLRSVTIPASVTSIGESAFSQCAALTGATIPNGVTFIGGSAFHNCTRLTSVTIPEGVTTIGIGAFYGCTGLTSVTIGDGVETIGIGAFNGCAGLTEITIPQSVTEIGFSAFADCAGLASATIHNPDTIIYDGVFQNCAAGLVIHGWAGSTADTYAAAAGIAFDGWVNGGDCGDNATWSFDPVIGKLTIGGKGEMTNYSFSSPAPWYALRASITSVEIGSGVTSIGNCAFTQCAAVTAVTIPEGVTSVRSGAFYGCSGLTAVTIPTSVTAIDYQAFMNCSALASVTIWNADTVIGDSDCDVFQDCAAGLVIHGWAGSTADTYAAAAGITFDGWATGGSCGTGVTWAFSAATGQLTISGSGAMADYSSASSVPWYNYRTNITSVEIGGSVTSIGKNAFNSCTSLTEITIPNGVTSIGIGAFRGCTGLTVITIPDSVTNIGYTAFKDCSNLSGVTFWGMDTVIGDSDRDVFDGCSANLIISGWVGSTAESYAAAAGITFDGWALSGTCGDNVTWAFDRGTGKLTISGAGEMTDYSSIWDIPWYPYSTSVKTVEIADGVTHIGNRAFFSCDALTSMTIPGSVASIGNNAFIYCASLTSVTISEGVATIGNAAFYGCAGLTGVTIPQSVTNIGYQAFMNCSALASVTIWNPDATIGDSDYDVFQNCADGLVIHGWAGSTADTYAAAANITFDGWAISGSCGTNVTWAFDPATGKLTISGTGPMTDFSSSSAIPWYGYRANITSAEIGSGVTNVGSDAFFACTALTSVTIPAGVTSIDSLAFYGCIGLTSVTLPEGVTMIDHSAFERCTGLTSVTIPEGVTTIGNSAFYCCSVLASVTIPNSVSIIDKSAFSGCTGLTGVTIGEGVTTIGQSAFNSCSSLTSVTIPASVTNIGYWAFRNCSSLTSATILNASAVIGDSDCDVFQNCAAGLVLHGYYHSTAETFAAAAGISFDLLAPAPTFYLPAGLTDIESEAFSGIAAQAVVIPKNIQSISGNPFAGSAVQTIYGFPGTAAETLAQNYPAQFTFLPLTDAWYAHLTD